MNSTTKKKTTARLALPFKVDSFYGSPVEGYLIEYDGWHFEADTAEGAINQCIEYIFKTIEENGLRDLHNLRR